MQLASYFIRCVFAYFMLSAFAYSTGYSQPSWATPLAAKTAAPAASGGVVKYRERVKIDTVYIVNVDTVIIVDTLRPAPPAYYNYTVYYEIVDKSISLSKTFIWDFSKTAQKTILQSSDTTLLKLGNELLRESSYTYDNQGNKTQTFEKVVEGLDMRVDGSNVDITYRVSSNLLFLNGKFDKFGLLQLSSDFSRRRYFLYLIPLDFLFSSSKYTLFLRVEKAVLE